MSFRFYYCTINTIHPLPPWLEPFPSLLSWNLHVNINVFCRHIQNVSNDCVFTSPIYSYTFHTKENLTAGVIRSSATCQWVYREAVKTMSRRMAKEAFSILLPRTESPTTRAACRTSFSTSSRRCMLRTTVPSWTSVSWAISAKGCGGGRRTKKYSQTGMDRLDDHEMMEGLTFTENQYCPIYKCL